MAELTTYTGGCHCGAVRYEVQADLGRVISCNCSICQKAGYLLVFAPAEQFALLSGEDALSDYRFNRNVINHQFCKTCGVHAFARGSSSDGRQVAAINVRCLDGVDLDALSLTRFNGRDM